MCGPLKSRMEDPVLAAAVNDVARRQAQIQQQNVLESNEIHLFEIHAPTVRVSLGSVAGFLLLLGLIFYIIHCIRQGSCTNILKWCCCRNRRPHHQGPPPHMAPHMAILKMEQPPYPPASPLPHLQATRVAPPPPPTNPQPMP